MSASVRDTGQRLPASYAEGVFGLAAPVWLAWMSTRMISNNFAVTEDYAYKASLAQSYVGFRDEAKGLDPLLEQRLFAAAITQLDANPLRFINAEHPGSPLQDLLPQPFMNKLMEDDSLKQKLIDWLKDRFGEKLSTYVRVEAPSPAETKITLDIRIGSEPFEGSCSIERDRTAGF